MSLPAFFLKAAQREVEEAAIWYEQRRSGLGAAFLAEVDRCVTSISGNPTRFACVYRDIQCVRLRRFPYTVFFRVEAARAVVIAVFHARRDPAAWEDRR